MSHLLLLVLQPHQDLSDRQGGQDLEERTTVSTTTMDSTTGVTDRCGQLSVGLQGKITLYTVPSLQRDFPAEVSHILGTTAIWIRSARCSTSARKMVDTTPSFAPTARYSTRGTSSAIGGTTSTATRLLASTNSTPTSTWCPKAVTKENRSEAPLVPALGSVVARREASRAEPVALVLDLVADNKRASDRPQPMDLREDLEAPLRQGVPEHPKEGMVGPQRDDLLLVSREVTAGQRQEDRPMEVKEAMVGPVVLKPAAP